MHKIIQCLFILIFSGSLYAQEDYFQQKTNYDIKVSLNDDLHLLSGTCDIEYHNQSSKSLDEIYLHLWPNAYKNRSTAMAKQLVENGNTNFYFAKPDQLGGYNDIDIKIEEKVVEWDYDNGNLDIVKIKLSKPLASGEKLTINTSFEMKIPDSFSRLGHVDKTYQMTQWYPKPAVYDNDGWHPMPYLDQGEFYSEFGDFEVEITLPKRYVVGATGVLQTDSEIEFINHLASDEKTGKHIYSEFTTHGNKTISYKAENVHDFAWFADPDYQVEKSSVTLSSGKVVDTYTMHSSSRKVWMNAISYVNRAVEFYSENVGEYPYPHATAVQSLYSAGGGMEYPMITLIGVEGSPTSLDEVITHEVGHNWFYGILATNERDHAWMDEGFNSYYERRYMAEYHKSTPNVFMKLNERDSDQLPMYMSMHKGKDQPICTHSHHLTNMNYWQCAYDRPAFLLEYLEGYWGLEEFDRIMKEYFNEWKFRHPQPEDVRAVFERESGENLSWLFDELIQTNKHLDYKMKSIRKDDSGNYILTIENVGEIIAPFPVQSITGGDEPTTIWIEGFEGEKEINFKVEGLPIKSFAIDHGRLIPDANRSNNTITVKGRKNRPLKFRFLLNADNQDERNLLWFPILAAWNKYDGYMMGAAFYSSPLPNDRWEMALAPMYGFKSKDVTGFAKLKYNSYPENLQRISFGVEAKRFSYDRNKEFYGQFEDVRTNLTYNRIKTGLEIEFKNKRARDQKKQTLSLDLLSVQRSWQGITGRDTIFSPPMDTSIVTTYSGHRNNWDFVPRLTYQFKSNTELNPYSLKVVLEQNTYKDNRDDLASYLKMSVTGDYTYHYAKDKGFYMRAFAGYFLMNTQRDRGALNSYNVARASFGLTAQGFNDPWFDGMYFGRSEQNRFMSQQVDIYDQGGFKTPLSGGVNEGRSNDFIAALNLKVDLPMKFPNYIPKIRPYVDLGYFSNKLPTAGNPTFSDQFMADAGIAIEMLDGYLGFYLPIISTKNVQSIHNTRGGYGTRVSFYLDMNRFNPNELIRDFGF